MPLWLCPPQCFQETCRLPEIGKPAFQCSGLLKPSGRFLLGGHLRMCAHEETLCPFQQSLFRWTLVRAAGWQGWDRCSSEAGHQFVLFTTPSLRGFGLTGFFLFVAGTWGELTLPLPNQVPLSDLHCLHLSEGSREALPSLSCLEKIHLSSLLGANSPCCSDYTCNSAEGRTGGSRPAWAGPCIQVEGKREERKGTLSQKMFEPRRSQIQPFN